MVKRKKTGGRQKGTLNKLTATVKASVEEAFAELGGTSWLVEQGRENPTAFINLLAKVMPTQVTGPSDGPVQLAASVNLKGLSAPELKQMEALLSKAAPSSQ